jgi:hypothetical protein
VPVLFDRINNLTMRYNTAQMNTSFQLFSYFNLLNLYKGLEYLNKKENELKDDVIYYIDLKNKTKEELDSETDELQIDRLKKDIEAYEKAVGDYNWNGSVFYKDDEITSVYPENPGIYSLLYENFKEYSEEYLLTNPINNNYPNNIQGEYET